MRRRWFGTSQCSVSNDFPDTDTSWVSHNSILSLSTCRKHYIPQGKGLVCSRHTPYTHTHTHTLQRPVANPGCHLCFWSTSYKPEAPKTPSLGFIHLLWHPRTKKNLLTRILVFYKRILEDKDEQVDEKMHRARSGRVWAAQELWSPWNLGWSPLAHGYVLVPQSRGSWNLLLKILMELDPQLSKSHPFSSSVVGLKLPPPTPLAFLVSHPSWGDWGATVSPY